MSPDALVAVLDRWRIDPAREDAFVAAWRAVTIHLREQHGSLGLRLHREADGCWLAYARWPAKTVREAAFNAEHPEIAEHRDAMRAAIVEASPSIKLLTVADELVNTPS